MEKTVNEVIELKKDMERRIEGEIRSFEYTTGIKVNSIHLDNIDITLVHDLEKKFATVVTTTVIL